MSRWFSDDETFVAWTEEDDIESSNCFWVDFYPTIADGREILASYINDAEWAPKSWTWA